MLALDAEGYAISTQSADVRSALADTVINVDVAQQCSTTADAFDGGALECPGQCTRCPLRNVALGAAVEHSAGGCYSAGRCVQNLVDGHHYFNLEGAMDWLVGPAESDPCRVTQSCAEKRLWQDAWATIALAQPHAVNYAHVFNQNEYNGPAGRDVSIISIDASNDKEEWISIVVNQHLTQPTSAGAKSPSTNPGDVVPIPLAKRQPYQFWRVTIRDKFDHGDAFAGLMEVMLLSEECGTVDECTVGEDSLCDEDSICVDKAFGYDCVPVRSSCLAHKEALRAVDEVASDGVYSIQTAAGMVDVFCDMACGGWTLVGKVSGRPQLGNMWLRSNEYVERLITPTLPEAGDAFFSCIDAVNLAVSSATDVRLSTGFDAANGCAGSKWVQWPLPSGRTVETFWNREEAGVDGVAAAADSTVVVTSSWATTGQCFQNTVGIMKEPGHGLGYPAATSNARGNTVGDDLCMAIGHPSKNFILCNSTIGHCISN